MSTADERLAEAARLSAVSDDPPEEPFKSKYAAREILLELLAEAEAEASAEAEADASAASKSSLGRVVCLLGINYAETEELSAAEKSLKRGVELLAGAEGAADVATLTESFNQLGILSANFGKHEDAKRWLGRAEAVVLAARPSPEAWKAVQGHYTHTLFYLAQVHGATKEPEKAADYCFQTLSRQLDSGQHGAEDWAENCVQLCQFYVNTGLVRQGLYLALAADHVRASRLVEGQQLTEEQRELQAKVARVRGLLHLTWLAESVRAFKDGGAPPPAPQQAVEQFGALEGAVALPDECHLARDYEAARDVFMAGLRAYTQAHQFYVLDGFVSAHVEVAQDVSQLYHLLCYFESDLSRKCKMYKRRVTLLEPLVRQLNPDVYSNVVRQLCNEVGSVYGSIMEMKMEDARRRGVTPASPDFAATVGKVNKLALNALTYHRTFLRLFNARGEDRLPDTMDEELHAPYLSARFEVAKLLGRIYTPAIDRACALIDESVGEYRGIREFVERYGVENHEEEVRICKEMESLLPIKAARIRAAGLVPFEF